MLDESNTLRIACVTYNVNARETEIEQINSMLDENDVALTDIVVIGLQEISHTELFGAVPADETWSTVFSPCLSSFGFTLLSKSSLASNLLLVFIRLDLMRIVDRIDSRYSKSTFGGLTGHKGSTAIRILLKNNSSLVFISSHLVPHAEGYEARCSQYRDSRLCCFEDEESLFTFNSSVIWLGDMNWRIDGLSFSELMQKLELAEHSCGIDEILDRYDQLRRAQRDHKAFEDFSEAPVCFPPTYRLLVGTSEFDAVRVPSWCDRILFKGSSLCCKDYRSNRRIFISDHFPVSAQFTCTIQPALENIHWNVSFHCVGRWLGIVPFTCRFTFLGDFWHRKGSYRDWIGIYDESLSDSPQNPIKWLYLFACYDDDHEEQHYSVAEFACLPCGRYRAGYYSTSLNCLQGLSEPFSVVEEML
ncbi:hypothetical protein AB6A40_002925 [Gnathostoma spinigerum]|uniref:Inositol polyphosphate-related phosphatase domain-containing protein n=1 Tax=Gnathostoma spinigerum TaxID=75299 RepID=A0ABD6EAJ1_9BILA